MLRLGLRIACKFVALGLMAVLWLVEPFWRLRFTHLWCARFGPLAYSTHLWVAKRRLEGPERRTTRLFFGAQPANCQLFAMWKRVLPIVESRALSAFYHYCGTTLSSRRFFAPIPDEFDNHRAIHVQPVLSFNAEDEARGAGLLAEMGMSPADWWICFQARDPLYHETRGFGDSGAHRNCRVENYLAAAAWVTARGGWALRMGAAVERPLPANGDPHVIDYAARHRSDFGDIYLLGKCRFLLACGTGTESVPPLFGIPVAKANMMPLRPTPVGANGLYIPKLIREGEGGPVLSFSRCQALGGYSYTDPAALKLWQYPGNLERQGLHLQENGEDDILDLCRDMFDRLDGIAPDPEAARLQAHYKARFFSHVPDMALMPDIGGRFALKYRHLIEG
ncbi:hypothetical protein CCC_00844 [Paramagnetospirillum magnetotacticum MS-1]|uniref:TIGR04372 family glycosyltransferase n=1 Tax=Paramagnetospirillum magnetotacticum MS-1 TaxID=272627 RepID=A0A0C2YRM5_PARME|nr:TIGR04372 family glycosyltransferase [Paramagnetospirillum magnetotacticum]KIL97783.1 hypothetical protein CCC_00844 [Paramagnetospirillum magnetotacticum MS-1]